MTTAPQVVAIGGGHGLASALDAARKYAAGVVAVVSVADDGGSSGRLVADLEILPPGDMRKCLVALAEEENIWAEALEHRFESGDLAGHSLGNVILAGLAEVCGGFPEALAALEALLGCAGKVLPATTEHVTLVAETELGPVTGQVAIANAGCRIIRVGLDPVQPEAHPAAVVAIHEADQVLIGPGSLYTSVLPPLAVPQIRHAVAETSATRVYICNLAWQPGETDGMDAGAHAAALANHGVEFDVMLYEPWIGPAGVPDGGVPPDGIDAADSGFARADFTTDGAGVTAVAAGLRLAAAKLASEGNTARHGSVLLAAALADLV